MTSDDLHDIGPGSQVWDCAPSAHPDDQIRGGLVWAVTETVTDEGEILTAYRTVLRVGRTVRFATLSTSDIRQCTPYSSASVRHMIRHLASVIGDGGRKSISTFDAECLDCLNRLAMAQ